MRLKVFGLFLAIQLFSLGLWYGLNYQSAQQDVLAAAPENASEFPRLKENLGGSSSPLSASNTTPVSDTDLVEKEDAYKITVRNWEDQHQTLYETQVGMIEKVVHVLPVDHTENLEIVLDYDTEAHRGWGGEGIVILAAAKMPMEELIAVMVHEIGHHVDAAFLNHTNEKFPSAYYDREQVVYSDDPSVAFYNLSWMNNKERRSGDHSDSVSGYGVTTIHEDFAETFAFYVLHGQEFEFLSKMNPVLKQKYDFMKNTVFEGRVFEDTFSSVQTEKRPWDVTRLDYNLNTFLLMNG